MSHGTPIALPLLSLTCDCDAAYSIRTRNIARSMAPETLGLEIFAVVGTPADHRRSSRLGNLWGCDGSLQVLSGIRSLGLQPGAQRCAIFFDKVPGSCDRVNLRAESHV